MKARIDLLPIDVINELTLDGTEMNIHGMLMSLAYWWDGQRDKGLDAALHAALSELDFEIGKDSQNLGGDYPFAFFPWAMLAMGEVLAYAPAKGIYDDRNWEKGMKWSRCYNAAQRHLLKAQGGEELDPETGLMHLAHAATNMLFLATYRARGMEKWDDRIAKDPA